MAKLFVVIYKFFRRNPIIMWCTLGVTTLLFAFFACKLQFEEDITKLLPETRQTKESGLAFEQISIKDKVFIQITSEDEKVEPEKLAEMADEFVEVLLDRDSVSHLISNVLYRVEDEWLVNGVDYLLGHFPSMLDSSVYLQFDSLLLPAAIDSRMAENYAVMAEDVAGEATTMICNDPAGLRFAMLRQIQGAQDGLGGYNILFNHLFSKDSTVALVFLAPNFNYLDSKSCNQLIGLIGQSQESFKNTHPEVEILCHGNSVISSGNSTCIKRDLLLTVGISLLIILVALFACYRKGSTLLMIVLPILYGTVCSMAAMYWLQQKMSLMSIGLGALVLGIAMSYILHIVTHQQYVKSPITVLREQSTPVCLSCLTTIGAFASLLFTHSALLKDFALFASFALVGATLCALVFVPQFFSSSKCSDNRAVTLVKKISDYPLDKKYWLLAVLIIYSVVCVFLSFKVKFDNDLNNIGFVSDAVRKSQDLYNQKVNNGYSVTYYAASSKNLDSALTYNRRMMQVMDSLRREGLVKQCSGVADAFLPLSKQQENIDAWKSYWTPEYVSNIRKSISAAAVKCNLEPEIFTPFYAILEADYQPESILDIPWIPKELSSNFIEKVGDDYLVFSSMLTDAASVDSVSDIVCALPHALVMDPFYYTDGMVAIVHNNFNVVLIISSLFVLLVLILHFRSVLLSILAFLPMFLSWYVVQGTMAILGIEFNLINIIISSIIFGVGVDYSIFVLNGLIAETTSHQSQTLLQHKIAITLSVFVLIVVLASLLFAVHPALRSVGVSTLIGMCATILLTYNMQPFLFRQLLKNKMFKNKVLKINTRK